MAKKSLIQKLSDKTPDKNDVMGALLAKGSTPRGLTHGQHIEGIVIDIGTKVLVVDIGAKSEGLVVDREFEAAASYIKTLKTGDKIQVIVAVPETASGQAMLSLREAAEDSTWQRLTDAKKNKTSMDVKVESATRGGLNVSIGAVEGFIPSSHLGSKLAGDPQTFIGKNLKVKVIEIDREKNKLVLSEKAVSEAGVIAEQEKALEKIKKGEEFIGRVVGVVAFGVFVQIKKDDVAVEGLVHLSELSWQKITDASTILKEGDEVKVAVIGKEEGRLALSIKKLQEDPWGKISEKYPAETRVSGEVVRLGDLGAFVQIDDGIEGLLRYSKIPSDISVKVSDKVDCFVEEVDIKNHRLSLGLALKAKPMGYK